MMLNSADLGQCKLPIRAIFRWLVLENCFPWEEVISFVVVEIHSLRGTFLILSSG